MRIAIAASEPDDTADICTRAARAPYFFLYDAPDSTVELMQNPFDEHERALGLRMADFLAEKGVALVIAQRCGNAFEEALERHGMRFQRMQGSVRDAGAAAYGGAGDPPA